MAYPATHRFNVTRIEAHCASIGASPVAAYARMPFRAKVEQFVGIAHASHTTGDCVVTIALNGTTVTSNSSAMTFAVASAAPGLVASCTPLSACIVQQDDYIAFTPASASGSSVPATFTVVLRAL